MTGSWKAGKAIKLGGTIWSQGNLKSKEPSIDIVRAWPRFAILRWWKRNNFCTDFLFCEERLSEDDFSNTEAYMKAFINGESGRSWKQFISNFDVFIHDSSPCHPIHTYQFHVSYIFRELHCLVFVMIFLFLPIDQPVYWILSKFRGGPYLNIWCLKQCFGTKYPEVSLIWKLKLLFILLFRPIALKGTLNVKSRNVDILGPVELIVWLEQANQGDRCEQDDQS